MKSVAFYHFPQTVTVTDRFWLFNPILKKRYENRPEERIRLKWVEYILHQTKWKKSRIGFESRIKVPQKKNVLRADLVLYSDSMKPAALIECKSDSVKLSQSAAEQAARYNSEVNAKNLVLTNGIEDYWFEKSGDEIDSAENFFEEHTSFKKVERDFKYWNQRGFCSTKTESEVKYWLVDALNTFWSDGIKGSRKYLDFRKTVLPVPMNQYYKVFNMDSERRLAVSLIGHGTSDNYLVVILNFQGVNQGVLAVNLDKYEKQENESIILIRGNDQKANVSDSSLPINLSKFDSDHIKNLPQYLIKFFD